MKWVLSVLAIALAATSALAAEPLAKAKIDKAQIPKWSAKDLDFFLHGSMSTEVVPERVLQTFIKIYPDLFPASDLAYLGLIPDPTFGWPIGFSRKKQVKHLGGMPAVGINCASCHVAQIRSSAAKEPINILGATSHFNVEAFFGSVLVATFKTSDSANMKKFLSAYLALSDPKTGEEGQRLLGKGVAVSGRRSPRGAEGESLRSERCRSRRIAHDRQRKPGVDRTSAHA